ncbi:MAG: response regulator transcription factor [Betaproteobacteria bacterium]|nr:response regulator transcription factor [Betaproteobacteria bacterium]
MTPNKPAVESDDLDFTKPAAIQPPAPTPQQLATAHKEAASGGAELRQAGYYVAIARRAAAKVPPRNGERHALLVIEDDPDLSNLLAEIFSVAGFEVRRAANRAQINAEINKPMMPDLILLDIVLPDADGLQILSRLRAHPKYARMPVIMMTGKAEAADVKAGLAAGADGYVSKPFRMSALVAAVSLVLGKT